MLFNIENLEWDNEALKKFKIPKQILPEVKRSSGVFGRTVRIGELPKGIPISGIAGDQQAALFGQACFEPGSIKNTYGTGCFVLLNVGKKRVISKHGLMLITPLLMLRSGGHLRCRARTLTLSLTLTGCPKQFIPMAL